MAASLMLLIAALAQISGAHRFNPAAYVQRVAPLHGPMTLNGHRLHGPVTLNRFPPPRMRLRMGASNNIPDFWKAGGKDGQSWHAKESFPPTTLYSIDSSRLLHSWTQAVSDQAFDVIGTEVFRTVMGEDWLPATWHPDQASGENWQEMAAVVQQMEDAIDLTKYRNSLLKQTKTLTKKNPRLQKEKSNGHLEAVGVISKAFDMSMEISTVNSNNTNGSLAVTGAGDASVQAFAIFSRQQLKDNSKRSLLQMLAAQQQGLTSPSRSHQATRVEATGDEFVSVLAIEGLAEAPSLPIRSARVLLAKIAKWAQIEHKLVVVPAHAVHLSDGTDLTAYYIRLGFEKVEMDDSSIELVYAGTSTPDKWSPASGASTPMDAWFEDQQVMVGLNLWSGAWDEAI